MAINNPLYDVDFLIKLSKNLSKETYARITSLSWDENPLERIEGKITAGTVNIDGSSAVRRTCSLTMVAENVDINSYYWGLKTKFKLEVGVKNVVNKDYDDIIWFPQGIYVITAFNSSISANNYTISISGKDKMCMLNGDFGGSLYASIDFGVEEVYDKENNITYYNKIPIKTILKNAIHIYGNEPLHNIIISDLDESGVELLEYRGDTSTPMFLFRETESDFYINMSLNKNQKCWVRQSDKSWLQATIGTIDSVNGIYDTRLSDIADIVQGTEVRLKNTKDATKYKIHKIEYGETVGYRLTDLTYAGDLISNVGESLTSVLDKIKNMLGDFEYFYDVNGRFIFQKKKIYLKNNWNSQVKREDDMYVESAAYTTALAYNFTDSHYFTALSHTPALNNLKNDFSVWGKRKGIKGTDLPVHIRYAIDKKPYAYRPIEISEEESIMLIDEYKFPFVYSDKEIDENGSVKSEDTQKREKYYQHYENWITDNDVDWRELIYLMAKDYFKYNQYDYFQKKVAEANANYSNPAGYVEDLYSTGYTGYEIYYTDLEGFWRELYNPEIFNTKMWQYSKPIWGVQYYNYDNETNTYKTEKFEDIVDLLDPDKSLRHYKFINGKYQECVQDDNFKFQYGEDYYNKTQDDNFILVDIYKFKDNTKTYYFQDKDEEFDINTNWCWNVSKNPELLNFWFDFIGEGSELDKYMVCNIGDRSKSINDSNVTGIYFKETPNVLFITNDEYVALAGKADKSGYTYIKINDTLQNFFAISAQGKSAHEVVETLLYENTYCIENISITSIPIYHLDANIRVEIHDRQSNIDGEYIISKITLPLTYNGTMSLTASKAVDTIY